MHYDPALLSKWLEGVVAGVYQPEPDEEIWEWAERTLRIPATENEEQAHQLWSSSYSPYVRELFEWYKRPGKGEFWIQKSSQVGFTMACLILLCWLIVHRSGNMIYAIDSEKQAREVSQTRLQKWIKDNNLLASVGESEDAMKNLIYLLKGLTLYMVGSHSKGSWATKSTFLVILDEMDKHPFIEGEGWTSDLARDRCKRPKNAKVIGFSTPGEYGQIGKETEAGTNERIHVKFPCCGHYQPLVWDNFIFGTDEFRDLAGDYDLAKVEAGAYFKCEMCGGRLTEVDKFDALQDYKYIPTNAKADPRVRSLKIWDAYSNFLTFGELAIGWIKAQGDVTKLEAYFRGRRGEYFSHNGDGVTQSELLDLRGAYRRGSCPITPLLLCQATDLQKDCKKSAKVAFDEKGDLYVIDWDIEVNFDEVVEFADLPVPSPDGDLIMTKAFVDEGNGSDTDDVREFCLANRPRFFPVKGRGKSQINHLVAQTEHLVSGVLFPTYHIREEDFKWQLLHRIQKGGPATQERRIGVSRIILPANADEDPEFLAELTNEVPVLEKNKFGREVWVWKKKGPNDFFDCIKYAQAIWHVMKPHLLKRHEEQQKESLNS